MEEGKPRRRSREEKSEAKAGKPQLETPGLRCERVDDGYEFHYNLRESPPKFSHGDYVTFDTEGEKLSDELQEYVSQPRRVLSALPILTTEPVPSAGARNTPTYQSKIDPGDGPQGGIKQQFNTGLQGDEDLISARIDYEYLVENEITGETENVNEDRIMKAELPGHQTRPAVGTIAF